MKKLSLGYESIRVYKYDCALFWKEYINKKEKKNECPICGTSRWMDKNNITNKVPHKVLRYFPLAPRLKCLYGCRHTAKKIRWHYTDPSNEDDVLRHHAVMRKCRKILILTILLLQVSTEMSGWDS